LPIDVNNLKKIRVLYRQNGKLKIKKTEQDCQKNGDKIVVRLTQEDTFCLSHEYDVEIQLRVLTHEGEPLVSDTFAVSVEECFDREVL
jgi:hypothetical protein